MKGSGLFLARSVNAPLFRSDWKSFPVYISIAQLSPNANHSGLYTHMGLYICLPTATLYTSDEAHEVSPNVRFFMQSIPQPELGIII